jgi:hypothetical protein
VHGETVINPEIQPVQGDLVLDELEIDFLGVLAVFNDDHNLPLSETAVEGLGPGSA